MSDLRDLYQEVIVDHSKRPRNFRVMGQASHGAEGFNPLCGDKIHLYLKIKDGVIEDASFQGAGCAISTASASLLTDSLKAKTVKEAEEIFEIFHHLVTGAPVNDVEERKLGKLAVFSGVCEFPARVKCASLAWHTLHNALRGETQTARTE